MPLLMFDFECESCGKFERLVDSKSQTVQCGCGKEAKRLISPVRLDWKMGVDTSLPTMADKWARMHEQKAKAREED